MPGKSPFSEDWRDCLKAHYTHVIRTNDQRTEKTLRTVLHECGYSDGQIDEWLVLATMHVDDAPPDFVPDMERAAEAFVSVPAAPPPAVEVAPPAEEEAPPEEDIPPHDPNGYQQMSLF